MLQDSLLKIKEEFSHPEYHEVDKLIELLGSYKSGESIYPGILKRKLNIDMICSYSIMKVIEELGLVQKAFFVQCSECNYIHRNLFDSINEAITHYEYCEQCDEIINFDSIQLIYMVNDNV